MNEYFNMFEDAPENTRDTKKIEKARDVYAVGFLSSRDSESTRTNSRNSQSSNR